MSIIIWLQSYNLNESVQDPFDSREAFDLVRNINDPKHPLTLEQYEREHALRADNSALIGLAIRVKLLCSLPPKFNVYVLPDVRIVDKNYESDL